MFYSTNSVIKLVFLLNFIYLTKCDEISPNYNSCNRNCIGNVLYPLISVLVCIWCICCTGCIGCCIHKYLQNYFKSQANDNNNNNNIIPPRYTEPTLSYDDIVSMESLPPVIPGYTYIINFSNATSANLQTEGEFSTQIVPVVDTQVEGNEQLDTSLLPPPPYSAVS